VTTLLDDDDEALALRLVGAIITIGLVALLAFGVHKARHPSKPALAAAEAGEMTLGEVPNGARVEVGEDGVVKFYFATASRDIGPGTHKALRGVLAGMQEGKTAVISGFHDTTGDPALNAELAKQRAISVQAALMANGAPAHLIELVKPLEMTGTGDDAEARRVEVSLR
jgi:outer membrane protein OmpA-like peptidoglycan-associated protein